jgi:hypothetical protein
MVLFPGNHFTQLTANCCGKLMQAFLHAESDPRYYIGPVNRLTV